MSVKAENKVKQVRVAQENKYRTRRKGRERNECMRLTLKKRGEAQDQSRSERMGFLLLVGAVRTKITFRTGPVRT